MSTETQRFAEMVMALKDSRMVAAYLSGDGGQEMRTLIIAAFALARAALRSEPATELGQLRAAVSQQANYLDDSMREHGWTPHEIVGVIENLRRIAGGEECRGCAALRSEP